MAEGKISAFLLPMLFNLDPLGARGVESVELGDVMTTFRTGKREGHTLRLDLGEAYDSFAEVIAAASQSGGKTVLDFGSLARSRWTTWRCRNLRRMILYLGDHQQWA